MIHSIYAHTWNQYLAQGFESSKKQTKSTGFRKQAKEVLCHFGDAAVVQRDEVI